MIFFNNTSLTKDERVSCGINVVLLDEVVKEGSIYIRVISVLFIKLSVFLDS